jgi:hypothetical protein
MAHAELSFSAALHEVFATLQQHCPKAKRD